MENFIKNLKISNFKSIREAELECGRTNLFVGKPNVGKSNVLEALSLFCCPFNKSKKFLSDFIRYERFKNLYYFQNTEKPIVVNSNIGGYLINHHYQTETYDLFLGTEIAIENQKKEPIDRSGFRNKYSTSKEVIEIGTALIQDDGQCSDNHINNYSPIKKYSFDPNQRIDVREKTFLLPPYGTNLFAVMGTNQKLKEIIPELFEEYGFEFLIDSEKSTFYLLRRENRIGYTIPYSLIADTLQRIIFHYAAIFSNKDSVILFEEPESHSFPPYVRELAFKIIESTDNQFFITTHSPYLFDTIVENTPPEELAVFVTYFEEYETKFKKLSNDEISEAMDYSLDIFASINNFVHG
ncbi:MAG: AAA family ATPase [Lewinellaceae bacterium]|nr:AAA family ATPase [Saprospiraceae bacterium]MCB9340754.1 AAA family ATPase [Lewinellaceae bacterium]